MGMLKHTTLPAEAEMKWRSDCGRQIQVERLLKSSKQTVRRVWQGIPAADGSLSNESRVGSERFCGCPQAGEGGKAGHDIHAIVRKEVVNSGHSLPLHSLLGHSPSGRRGNGPFGSTNGKAPYGLDCGPIR